MRENENKVRFLSTSQDFFSGAAPTVFRKKPGHRKGRRKNERARAWIPGWEERKAFHEA